MDLLKRSVFGSGVGRRLVLALLVFSSVITFLGTSLQLFLSYSRDVKAINERLQQIETSYLQSICVSLWSYNDLQLQALLNGIIHLPDVEYLDIRKSSELVVTAGKPEAVAKGPVVERAFPLYYSFRGEEHYLGDLTVKVSLKSVYNRMWNMLFVILGVQAVKTFMVSAFFLFIFYLLVGRHLVTLADFFRRMDLHHLDTPLRLGRKNRGNTKDRSRDELDILVQAFNAMRENIGRDMEARKEFARALEESEKKYRELVEGTTDLITRIDPEGNFTFVNPQAEVIFGVPCEELIGMSALDFLHEDDRGEVNSFLAECVENHTLQASQENRHVNRKSGTVFTMLWTILFHYDERGGLAGVSGIARDITRRKQNELEREKLIGELQKALEEIHTLRTILPICSYCKKIRNDEGYYEQLEDYLHRHNGVDFSHTICNSCLKEKFPQIYDTVISEVGKDQQGNVAQKKA